MLRHCDYVSNLTSKSSNMTNVTLHMQLFIIKSKKDKWPTYVLRYFVPEYHDAVVYLIVGKDYIDVVSQCRY